MKLIDNKLNLQNTKKGFTLIELLLYMALVSIFIVLVSNITLTTLELQARNTAITDIELDAQYLMLRLRYDILRADSVVSPANLGDNSDVLILNFSGQNYTYSTTNGIMQINTGTDIQNLNSNVISVEPVFKRLGNLGGDTYIEVNLRVSSDTPLPSGNRVLEFKDIIENK